MVQYLAWGVVYIIIVLNIPLCSVFARFIVSCVAATLCNQSFTAVLKIRHCYEQTLLFIAILIIFIKKIFSFKLVIDVDLKFST